MDTSTDTAHADLPEWFVEEQAARAAAFAAEFGLTPEQGAECLRRIAEHERRWGGGRDYTATYGAVDDIVEDVKKGR